MSHIMNPETGRMVKIGGKPWRALVKKGLIPNDPITPAAATPNEIYEGVDEDDAKQMQSTLKTKGKPRRTLAKNTHTQRRGKKLIQVANQPKQEDIASYYAQSASRTVHKNMPALTKELEEAYDENDELSEEALKNFEAHLRELIHQEAIAGGVLDPPNKYMRKGAPPKQKGGKYELADDVDASDESFDDVSDDSEIDFDALSDDDDDDSLGSYDEDEEDEEEEEEEKELEE